MGQSNESILKGRRVAAGAASRAWFANLFGLSRPGGQVAVTAVAWVVDHVEFTVRAGSARGVVFILAHSVPSEAALVSTPHLALRYHAKTLSPKLATWMETHGKKRLPSLTMEHIMAVLANDPELGKPGSQMPSSAVSHPAHQLDTWGADNAWADFFARGEVARGQLDSIHPNKLFRFIQHGDCECLDVNPYGIVSHPLLVDYPWLDRGRIDNVIAFGRREAAGEPADSDNASVGEMLTTDLTEMDVVMGNHGKVRAVLEKAIAARDPQERILFFSNTCVPTVSGEDVASVVREYQAKSPTPLVYLTVTPKAMNDVFRDLLVRRRQEAERIASDPDPKAVNLIGFEPGQATDELVANLAACNVRVNTQLIPTLEMGRIAALPGASLNVFRPNQVWSHFYDQLREGTRIPSISPTAPMGLEGTQRWIREVLIGLGIPYDPGAIDCALQEEREPWNRAVERIQASDPPIQLGFVVRGEELHFLLDASQTWGFNMLAFAREVGVGVDVFVQSADLRAGSAFASQLAKAIEPGPTWSLQVVRTFDALMERLAASACQAVFGHHFFDWRLSQCGKARFSLQQFELGIAGGARTLDRLRGICANPFYRTYAKYLTRDREGLRRKGTGT